MYERIAGLTVFKSSLVTPCVSLRNVKTKAQTTVSLFSLSHVPHSNFITKWRTTYGAKCNSEKCWPNKCLGLL